MKKGQRIFIAILILGIIGISAYFYKNNFNENKNKYNWYLTAMNLEELNKLSKGESQCIAFIDSGVSDELLEKFGDRIIYKYNLIDKSEDVNDENGHGTEMVSVACNNGYKGVYGIAPNSKVIVLKIVDNEVKTNNEVLSEAIKIAIQKGATIINISLGGNIYNKKVMEQIKIAINKNITIVAAAGDYGDKDLLFPASCDGVISVQGLDSKFKTWEYSNTSSVGAVTFPCEKIDSLEEVNNELSKIQVTGTSQATALTSGYIALIKDYAINNNIKLDNEKLRKILLKIHSFKKSNKEYVKAFDFVK